MDAGMEMLASSRALHVRAGEKGWYLCCPLNWTNGNIQS